MDCHCPFNLYGVLSGKIILKQTCIRFVDIFYIVFLLTFVNTFWQIPLFGVKPSESVDRFYHIRVIGASHRGIVLTINQNFD